jgi:hypothetical protein
MAAVATMITATKAILVELCDWDDLDRTAPGLAVVRARLSGPRRGLRII